MTKPALEIPFLEGNTSRGALAFEKRLFFERKSVDPGPRLLLKKFTTTLATFLIFASTWNTYLDVYAESLFRVTLSKLSPG